MTADIIQFGDADLGEDCITATLRGNGVHVHIEEPWAGDTETGFGESSSFTLTAEQATALGEWLIEAGRRAARGGRP